MAKVTYGTGKQILMKFSDALTKPATMKNDSATANDEGRKIIKAGTPLGAAQPFLDDPDNVVLAPVTDWTAQVVAMHDVDITNGQASDTVIVKGEVVKANMDSDVLAMYTDDVKKALTHIIEV